MSSIEISSDAAGWFKDFGNWGIDDGFNEGFVWDSERCWVFLTEGLLRGDGIDC